MKLWGLNSLLVDDSVFAAWWGYAFGVCISSVHKGSWVPVPAQGAILVYIEFNSNPSLPNCLPLFVAQSITIYEEKTFFPFHTSQTEEVWSEAEEFCSFWVIASGQMTASNSELCVALPFHAVLVVSMTVRAPVCLCSLWGTVCACNPPYVAMSNRERKSDPWKLMFSMLI